jgi:hypothetical protein
MNALYCAFVLLWLKEDVSLSSGPLFEETQLVIGDENDILHSLFGVSYDALQQVEVMAGHLRHPIFGE